MIRRTFFVPRVLAVLAIVAGLAVPVSATTLVRASLEHLVATHESIVIGEVLDVESYWNDDHTFILTDVRVAVDQYLKTPVRREGAPEPAAGDVVTLTLMGGTVGDLTTVIVGGADLHPDKSYVLFLGHDDLPGKPRALTVRAHCQGAFDIIGREGSRDPNQLRAVSQANRHPLVPDAQGYLDAPGGTEGIPFGAMIQSVRQLVRQNAASQGVNQ